MPFIYQKKLFSVPPMSDAAHAFQKLHLDDMPVTRSHARSLQQGRPGDRVSTGSSRMNPLSRPVRTPGSRGHSHSGSHSSHPHGGSPAHSTPGPSVNPVAGLFKVEGIDNEGQHIDFSLTAADGVGGQVIVSLYQDPAQPRLCARCSQAAHVHAQDPCIHIEVSYLFTCWEHD